MARDYSIKKVLVIGSGPIVIGQAAEFDYAGTQACRALKEEGIEVILINSNPATIMTDKEIADKIYIEPLTSVIIEKVLEKEKPDSILAGMGGQTALNLVVELYEKGILDKCKVRLIGTSIEGIKVGEDREKFQKLMAEIKQPVVEGKIVNSLEEGLEFANSIGFPVVVRPAYTLGGTGGGIAENENMLEEILVQGLQLSRVGQVLIEKSIKGWKEIEYEVIRDGNGNCITVCNMENLDPVGVHTGDSIVVAPSQTLTDKEYQMLRSAAIEIINTIDIKGGCNVQFALNPKNSEYVVIEINPRVSRSSALASKATGYPIAKVAAKIALGYHLDEIINDVTGKTYACFEPTLDYVVVKMPKWPFEKFRGVKKQLGTKMMATGEIMAIGSNFEAAFLKGIRSLEIGQYTLENKGSKMRSIEELKDRVQIPDDERIFDVAELLRRNFRVDKVSELTGIDSFFLGKIKNIVEEEKNLKKISLEELTPEKLRYLKEKGFSDKGIADLMDRSPQDIYQLRKSYGINPVYKMVDTCGGEFEALSPYYYSTYGVEDEVKVTKNKKVMVIGSGPIRIGQGIEFDYCSVHSILALREMGIETIIVNNNPETVSTDFDISDKLYFEPLTEEDILNIVDKEKPDGVILQFGGQTAIKLADFLKQMRIPILGTKPEDIDIAEDREKFDKIMEKLCIKRPKGKAVWSVEEGLKEAGNIGYPLLVRPSYVLGGQGMEIIYGEDELKRYLEYFFERNKKNSVLIDQYLLGRELEIDGIWDGENILIPGIIQHLERAGIHSGDSITRYPDGGISKNIKEKILQYTIKIAQELKVLGMINIQFVEYMDELYVLEVNPRSSRTVPYISKVTNIPLVKLATRVMLGEKLKDLGYGTGIYPLIDYVTVKVPVFSTEKIPLAEVSLGPEMKSTGEVMGIGKTFEEAMYKGFIASGMNLPFNNNKVIVTLKDGDKEKFLPMAKDFKDLGFEIFATKGTAIFLREYGYEVTEINKISEGVPNILDLINSGLIDLVINTPTKGKDSSRDGFRIRRRAIESSVKVLTSLDTVSALLQVLKEKIDINDINIYPLFKKNGL
ncbi:carbamoyl-phosphate synthase large subunit [Anaerobranca californiensis DSM 14826]|uniref:Carbamoyl phosphate synthase large chain n=1 Tax=Anaerobranca californiensis DSM 14826 TaxID=1120989 RepID=A0A1M6K6T0_9FIRM|nr:carbamoyl-phosphate synthase large subunit [Anaerobranca californiensis]SHJ54671.1 carbamoyl-phosphate synthase large subunit [Anaerobranca californiensis DSM 14826]